MIEALYRCAFKSLRRIFDKNPFNLSCSHKETSFLMDQLNKKLCFGFKFMLTLTIFHYLDFVHAPIVIVSYWRLKMKTTFNSTLKLQTDTSIQFFSVR